MRCQRNQLYLRLLFCIGSNGLLGQHCSWVPCFNRNAAWLQALDRLCQIVLPPCLLTFGPGISHQSIGDSGWAGWDYHLEQGESALAPSSKQEGMRKNSFCER